MTTQPERRKSPRVKHGLPVKVSADEMDFITQTQDIGVNGALFRLEKAVPLMSRLAMTLLVPSHEKKGTTKKIVCNGVVVRCEPFHIKETRGEYNIAVYFTALKDSDKKALMKYVNAEAGGGGREVVG